ncbi:hypothetical protein SEA_MASELOP_71 [Rhodococcus phage Maselop]|nr:hypothetical protein SEA_BRAXOADDIE_71 [Rhodococcus phage Braxoaddie]WNM64994.1 hypothetical protein SEA_MASELOP_71 [Rhodococcus phage Maselop]
MALPQWIDDQEDIGPNTLSIIYLAGDEPVNVLGKQIGEVGEELPGFMLVALIATDDKPVEHPANGIRTLLINTAHILSIASTIYQVQED